MSRAVALLACVSLALAAACGGGGQSQSAASAATKTAPAASSQPAFLAASDLPSLAIGLADLPKGFSVAGQGSVPAGTAASAYRRAFDPGNATLGRSRLADLISDVVLFGSPEAAKTGLARVLAGLAGQKAEQAFSSLVLSYSGIEAKNLVGRTLASPALGDGAVVADAVFDTPAGRAEAVFMVVRIGWLQTAVFAIGPAGEARAEDVIALMQRVVRRTRAAVAAKEPAA